MTDALSIVRWLHISAAALLWAFPAYAHHSTAMFDMDKTVTLKGAIKAFHWTNPHCSLDVLVSGPNGEEDWSVQLGPPTRLYRDDWKPLMFKPGDSIIVVVHPMRNGTQRGLWVSDTVNGRPNPGVATSP